MNDKKGQEMRVKDSELEMLKSIFSDREDFLKTIRNVFFGLPITPDESDLLKKTFSSKQLTDLMSKLFLPVPQSDDPISQSIDLYMTIDLKDKSDEEVEKIIEIFKLITGKIEKSLSCIVSGDTNLSVLDWNTPRELLARNQYAVHVDRHLSMIRILAGTKVESVEETKKRLLQNSNK